MSLFMDFPNSVRFGKINLTTNGQFFMNLSNALVCEDDPASSQKKNRSRGLLLVPRALSMHEALNSDFCRVCVKILSLYFRKTKFITKHSDELFFNFILYTFMVSVDYSTFAK